jgi:predicted choloylglycine hydrolase
MIDPSRSRTGGSLLGRNWDFPPIEGIHAFNLIIVYRPQGKRPFIVVSYPGTVAAGCLMSAMNADGLVLGGNYIGASADGAPQVEWKNLPSAVLARRVMEECATLKEAEKLLRADMAAERGAIVACDRTGGAVFEITPKTVVVRRGKDGICVGTNHFLSRELGVATECRRLNTLSQAARMDKLGVADVAKKMHEANQGAWTAHTMVFEPESLKLHVAFGDGKKSATSFPLKSVDLKELLKR